MWRFMSRVSTLLSLLKEPECLLRPRALCSYYRKRMHNNLHDFEEIMLPWGCKIGVKTNEFIGRRLIMRGVFDLCVSETIWRLLDTGQCAVDIGANIGYMTSIMAAKVGNGGTVIAFEPHPGLYQELLRNVNNWKDSGKVIPYNIALSDECGEGILRVPYCYDGNRGSCSLVSDKQGEDGSTFCQVQTKRLDQILGCDKHIELLKIDVEGHELEVLRGCLRLIENQQITTIIYEDHNAYPSIIADFLEKQGYKLFYLGKRFFGLAVGRIERKNQEYKRTQLEGPSYLATREPKRVLSILETKGWDILK